MSPAEPSGKKKEGDAAVKRERGENPEGKALASDVARSLLSFPRFSTSAPL